MKLFIGRGVVLQQLARFKLRSILVGKAIHEIHVLSDTDLVQVTERSATEGSKARTKDQPNVTDNGIRDNFVLQALGGLIDKTVVIE
jgi:hypothetical protein